jgi:hypothetical protein
MGFPGDRRLGLRHASVGRRLRAPFARLLDRMADRSCSGRQAGLQEELLALQAARIVSETTKCLWRASLPTWTITGHLLLRQRRYGFHVLDRIDRERDGAVLPSHCR